MPAWIIALVFLVVAAVVITAIRRTLWPVGLFVGLLAISVLLTHYTSASFGTLIVISMLLAVAAKTYAHEQSQFMFLTLILAAYLVLGLVGIKDNIPGWLQLLFWATWVICLILRSSSASAEE